MKRTKKGFFRGMAGVLCASMLISTGTPAMQVRAVEGQDAE